ncbi:hypothetical protein B14911_03454 [Bacillus sp. NRRL B-14911]|uniref:Competence protein CoiA n=1 Tax=Bacillus infantis NRRL B-14911 TaxID=1367477 RepID=U5LIF0_9BACI|nr:MULTISPECIES: competence protein CoiA family protein [Bacillus]AGX06466.1 hypothetical protein N288_23135 [Bacillus infantis NRRL B-14911]EAR68607.1 hypothetical protein B14911_03454 [Bacillus sp. NRRL B-14911]
MLKALLRDELINLASTHYKDQRSRLKSDTNKDQYICPYCNGKVVINWAEVPKRIPHFSHRQTLECIYEGGGETESHRLGKVKLFNYLESLLNHKVRSIEIEHYIPETRQIADVFIEFENGVQWVVEYQRSNISPEKIQERKKLYQKAGIKDIWIIGENLINSSGLVTYTVKRAAEALIEKSFNQPTLVSFNPATDFIEIFRGLERVNNRTYYSK